MENHFIYNNSIPKQSLHRTKEYVQEGIFYKTIHTRFAET